jgi:hypothetical protein
LNTRRAAAADTIAEVLEDNPDATFTRPGFTDEEPLVDVAKDASDELLGCPAGATVTGLNQAIRDAQD